MTHLETAVTAARVRLGTVAPEQLLRAVGATDDHEALLGDARREGLAGLLAFEVQNRLGRHGFEPFAQVFQDEFVRNGIYMAELHRLDEAFVARGRQAVVLKGAALILGCYDRVLGIRPLSDIDIMIRASDVALFHELMLELGYTQRTDNPLGYLHQGYAVDFQTDALGRLETVFAFDNDELWKRSVPLAEDLPSLRTLSPEDQFLQVAVHALKHSFHRLIWLVDLGLLLPTVEPSALVARARETGTTRVLAYSAVLLERLLGLAPDSRLVSRLPRLNRLERRYLEAVVRRGHPVTLGKLVAFFSVRGWRDRLFYLFELCRPQTRQATWGQRLRQLARLLRQLVSEQRRPAP